MYIQGDWVRRAFLMDWTVLICYICLMTHLCHDGRFFLVLCMYVQRHLCRGGQFFFRVCYATLCIQLCRGHCFFCDGCFIPIEFNYVVAIVCFFAMDLECYFNSVMN